MELDERLLATPGYLEKNGTPKTVDDLRTHRLLVWEAHGRAECELPRKDGTTLAIVPALRMNDVFFCCAKRRCAISESCLHPRACAARVSLREEALVGVLEAEVGRKTALWFLAHSTTLALPSLRTDDGRALETALRLASLSFGDLSARWDRACRGGPARDPRRPRRPRPCRPRPRRPGEFVRGPSCPPRRRGWHPALPRRRLAS